MNQRIDSWLNYVFSHLKDESDPDFAGLGLIFYNQPLDLPVRPLGLDRCPPGLPSKGHLECTALLKEVSKIHSPYHDGFHLVDAASLNITHVSQFFAPPILHSEPQRVPDHPVGARFMAAYLGSFLPGVELIATLSNREGALTFKKGSIQKKSIKKEKIPC
ncbi:hypothetical protein [Duganella sp. HH101]|uniref:hypothetical protein n=1 Tax=Duganella sp. HH101 TaxID=1781066 RepID=UPI00114D2983|nr:hypothetical protein [Duganella sp. HH101]